MKTTVEVKNRKEGEDIRAGLEIPEVRAFVIIAGVLSQLPTDRARWRVMSFVQDKIAEQKETGTTTSSTLTS